MPFDALLTPVTPEVLLRNDFTLKTASYFFIESLYGGELWLLFPTGQLMLLEAIWATSMVIPLSEGESEPLIPSLRVNVHGWGL